MICITWDGGLVKSRRSANAWVDHFEKEVKFAWLAREVQLDG